jgi:Flp pilus assembly protein CpaB
MATIGRTLFRLTGALLLGASATSIDNPRLLFAPSSRVKTVPVVVAAKDIPQGAVIDRTSVVVAQWPAEAAPPGAYMSVEALSGRVTRAGIYKGEAILPNRLALEGTPPGIEPRITPGKRAVGIRVDATESLVGLVQPNTRVDIILVINDPDQRKPVAKLFMENMRVLAIAPLTERAEEGRSIAPMAVASIEVTPAEAERLAIAAAQGSLQLVLRGYSDPYEFGRPIDQDRRPVLKDLLLRKGQSQRVRVVPRPVKPVRPDSFALKLFRGTTTAEELKFAKDSAARADSLQRRP